VLLSCAVGFRTQRQTLASDLDLRATARSFFADLVQATFGATYRTGLWPRRFRSFVARALAARIARRCSPAGERLNDALALDLLDISARWEDPNIGFEQVTKEVNKIAGEADESEAAPIEGLFHKEHEEAGDDDGN
jgi:hypothetical protein